MNVQVVHHQVDGRCFRVLKSQPEGCLCELDRRTIRRGECEVPARLRLYRTENIGCTTALVFVIPSRFPSRYCWRGGRTSAWSVTGFSSKHTTGSSGLQGFSYVSSTSSIFATYSSLSSATHHIFFPPRLEVVVEQQNPNALSSYSRNQFPLHRFLGHQTHGPSGKTLRRIAADHGDNALLLAVVKQPGRPGPLLFIKRAFKAPLPVAMADLPNRLRSQRQNASYMRRADPFSQLQERDRPQHHTHLLHTAAQQRLQLFLVLLCDFDMQGGASHTPSMPQNISEWNCCIRIFSRGRRPTSLLNGRRIAACSRFSVGLTVPTHPVREPDTAGQPDMPECKC